MIVSSREGSTICELNKLMLQSVVHGLLDGLEKLAVVGQVKGLENQGERRVISANALHRRLQVVEGLGLNGCCEFSTEAASDRGFVSHDALACLLDRVNYGLLIPGKDCAQVDNLNRDARLLGPRLSHANLSQLHAVRNDGDVGTFLHNLSLAERNFVVFGGHVFLGNTVQNFGLEEQARVLRPDAAQQQALSLHGGARDRHNQAGSVREVSLRGLTVVVGAVADSSVGRPDGQLTTVKLVAGAVPKFSRLVDDLVDHALVLARASGLPILLVARSVASSSLFNAHYLKI